MWDVQCGTPHSTPEAENGTLWQTLKEREYSLPSNTLHKHNIGYRYCHKGVLILKDN